MNPIRSWPHLLTMLLAMGIGQAVDIVHDSMTRADDLAEASELTAPLQNQERTNRLEAEAQRLFYEGQFESAQRMQAQYIRALSAQDQPDVWRIAIAKSMSLTFERLSQLGGTDQKVIRGALRQMAAGTMQFNAGRAGRAKQLFEQAIHAWSSVLDSSDLIAATVWEYRAKCDRSLGNHADALAAIEKSLALRGELLGKSFPLYATTLGELGVLQTQMRDFENAEPNLRRALELLGTTLGERSFEYCFSLFNYAELKLQRSDPEAAEEHAAKAVRLLSSHVPDGHPALIRCRWKLARSLADQGDTWSSLEIFERIIPLMKQADYRIEIEDKSEIFRDYAEALRKSGQTDEADEQIAWSRNLSPTPDVEPTAGRDKPAASAPFPVFREPGKPRRS